MSPLLRGPRGGASARAVFGLPALCLALAGCAVGPDYAPPSLSVPAEWTAPGAEPRPGAESRPGAPALGAWWTRFGDSSLSALVDQALAANTDLEAARARLTRARAALRQATGADAPSLDVSGGAGPQGNLADGPNGSYSTQLDAGWEIDLFGANRRATEAAFYGVGQAEAELRDTLVTLIGDVAASYVDLRAAQASLALARRTARAQRQTAGLTQVRYEAGAASGMDVANAAGQAASTEADIPQLEIAQAEAINRLSVLTGAAPARVAMTVKAPAPIPQAPAPNVPGVPAAALGARPDVRAAERALAQATAEVGQAQAAEYPSLSLGGTLATSADQIGTLADGASILWSIGPSISIPIFNGGQLAASTDQARALREESFANLRGVILSALAEVENALFALDRERRRGRSLEEASRRYAEAARLARSLFSGGETSFLDVLDAQRSAYAAESALIRSRADLANDYVALNKALGGGWDGAAMRAAEAARKAAPPPMAASSAEEDGPHDPAPEAPDAPVPLVSDPDPATPLGPDPLSQS